MVGMHYIHKILVNIPDATGSREIPDRDSLLSAIRDYAESITESYQDVAFDWRETETAGRWSDEYPVNVVLGKDDARKFVDDLNFILNCQKSYIRAHMKTIEDLVGSDLNKIVYGLLAMRSEQDSKNGFDSKVMYNLKELADALCGEYTFDSGFFNTHDITARLYPQTIKTVKKRPEDWALVMFDYHI